MNEKTEKLKELRDICTRLCVQINLLFLSGIVPENTPEHRLLLNLLHACEIYRQEGTKPS